MMKVIIVEDETNAIKNLKAVLSEIDINISVIASLQTVNQAVDWIENNPSADLAFFDIHLSDGLSFEIFEKIEVKFPVVFTTAYNQYALRAFKVNSIDYVLKPIKKKELAESIDKYRFLKQNFSSQNEMLLPTLKSLSIEINQTYKKTLLVEKFDGLIPVPISDFAFFQVSNTIVYGHTFNKERFVIDDTLDNLEKQLSPSVFFRANRQFIVSKNAIKEASFYFNRRFVLKIYPTPDESIIISKAKVAEFKEWLVK
jgi:two-component system LytT family response regulator